MLFTNKYSGLITKGLGMPACCGLLTMGFGLFSCIVIVTEPPDAGGGGGSYAVEPGIYVPWKGKTRQKTKNVQIIVKFSKEHTWRKAYVVSSIRADMIVKAINIVNAATQRLQVGVQHLKHATRRVTAVFGRGDK